MAASGSTKFPKTSAPPWRAPALPLTLGALLVFAFGLRVVFMLLAGLGAPLAGDELAYQQIAENVAAGRGLFQTNNPFFPGQTLYAWQPPLYPLLLGILYKFVGANVVAAKFLNILLSTLTVALIYDLAQHILPASPAPRAAHRAALAAAFLTAIYPGFLTNAHLLLSETLFIACILLAFVAVARALAAGGGARFWLWLGAAGAAWGLATLTRGLTLYFTPLFALWVAWALWRRARAFQGGSPRAFRRAGFRAARAALVLLAAAAFVILPYTARNYFQFRQFVPLETKGGVNFWLGNSPYTPDTFIRNVWKVGVREPLLNALPKDELARDRAGYQLGLNYIRSAPLTFLARMPVKFADFWGFERNLVDIAEATTKGGGWNSLSKIGGDLLGSVVYIFVMLGGVAGFMFAPDDGAARAQPPWKFLIGGFILYFLLAHVVIFGDGRFHLPLIPFFILYTAWLCAQLAARRRAAGRLPVAGGRVALILLFCALLIAVWLREAYAAWLVLRAGL